MSLTREQIKAADDRPREWVAIPEWTPAGQEHDARQHGVYVATMSGRQRDAWEAQLLSMKGASEQRNNDNLRARLATMIAQDASGNRIFTDADAEWLSDKSAIVLDRIADAAIKLNKIGRKEQDELVKNS